MTAKNLLALVLLLFVVGAVVTMVLREARTDPTTGSASATEADAQLPANGVVAYYFHSNTRCPTCRNIEAYAHEAIEVGFAPELAAHHIVWRLVNYELPANAHFVTDYEIAAPTVVLVRMADGEPAEWRNLDRVWELVGKPESFHAYVQDGVTTYLKQTSRETEPPE